MSKTPAGKLKRRRKPRPMEATSSFAEAANKGKNSRGVSRSGYHADPMSSYREDAYDAGSHPRRRKGLARRAIGGLLLLSAFALLGAIVVGAWLYTSSDDSIKAGQKVSVTVPKGADGSQIAALLSDAGVVRNPVVFKARLRFSGDSAKFRAGKFTMITGSDYTTVVKTLTTAPPAAPVWKVTFPEGQRMTEMAATISKTYNTTAQTKGNGPRFNGKQYLAAAKRAKVPAFYKAPAGTSTVEGLLFPATYEMKNTATADQLVAQQLGAMDKTMSTIDMTYAASKNLTPYEVVIIASMVEREAQLPKERPLVAAVIYNRLKLGMTLGIDATIQYAVDPNVWKKDLTVSDLAIDSPFNTRVNAGLPPTPIANPGKASLEAAAAPAKVDYLYYVAKPDGSGAHTFTTSLAAHEAAQQ